jgi:O-antigen ligase
MVYPTGAPTRSLARPQALEIGVTSCIVAIATGFPPACTAVLAALCVVVARDHHPDARTRSNLPLIAFAAVGLMLVITGLIAFAWAPVTGAGVRLVAQFAAIPTIALVSRVVRPDADLLGALWRGVTIGAWSAAALAVVEVAGGSGRAEGLGDNAIVFGDNALLLGAMSLSLLPALHRGRRRADEIAASIGAASGLLASLLSGSRGGWIAVPVLALLIATQYRRDWTPETWQRAIGSGAMIAGLVVLIAGRTVVHRVRTAGAEITAYIGAGPSDPGARTSIGARFEAWRSAADAFAAHPITGVGWGNLSHHFDVQAYTGTRSPRIATFDHAHHQVISGLASAGLLGAAALIAVLAVPATWFVRSRRGDTRQRAIGTTGLVVVAGFAIAGLTEAVFESFVGIVLYAVTVSILAGEIPDRLSPETDERRASAAMVEL